VSSATCPNETSFIAAQLPIPDRPFPCAVLHNAKDRDAKFPPIRAAASARGRSERPHHPRTEPIGFGYEYTDVGRDAQSPVTHDYAEGDNTFTGTIKWIEMEAGQDSHDHLVDPGQVFHYHMAKQ
jgi:hypothetical protein